MSDNMFVEDTWVCNLGGLRFLGPDNVKIYDDEGNEMHPTCACGKPATNFLYSEIDCLKLCHECAYGNPK